MSEKAKIGIIGAGYIGEVHIQSMQAGGRANVVAICDIDEQLLKSHQETYGIPAGYTDFNRMLEAEDLDGVVVATPDEYHRAPAVAVAEAGKALMLEKPIATSWEDAKAIVSAVETNGVECLLGFTLRFMATYAAVKERFDSGELGAPRTAFVKRACRVGEAVRLSGRCSVNEYLAVHDLDFLLWVFGNDVESIYTVSTDARVHEMYGTPDHFWNTIKWRNGATASVFVTWGMPDGYPIDVDSSAMLVGSVGAAQVFADVRGQQTYLATEDSFVVPEVFAADAYVLECAHFADVCQGIAEPVASVYDGLNAYALVAAGNESLRTGKPASVKLI